MTKFSLYDLLGLLLPGVILVWLLNVLNSLFRVLPFPIIPSNWKIGFGILFCLALIAGASLYVFNFRLAKWAFYKRTTKIYKHVAELYLEMGWAHQMMNGTLNYKARKWYNREIFFDKASFNGLPPSEQEKIKLLQDEYYDRMYYELDYQEKMEHARTFQSFYFFFRQSFSVCWLGIFLIAALQIICFTTHNWLLQPALKPLAILLIALSLAFFLTLTLARWYRKRMVMKMYWAYFSHLNQTINQ